MTPRALVIAYDFPPHGAIGTMRTLRLVRELHQQQWNVTVLTGHPETYLPGTPEEPALQALVPPGVRVLAVRARRPFSAVEAAIRGRVIARDRERTSAGAAASHEAVERSASRHGALLRGAIHLRDLAEAALDIPDKESGWIMPAVARGLYEMARHGRPDVIYSSAPPWSGQVVARALASLSRRPWVADFRDPWARAPWREWRQPFRQRAAAALERAVVRRADAVLFVTAANRAEFAETYGAAFVDRFHLVPNGCDPTEMEGLTPLPARGEFVLLHAGTLYGPRSPLPVIRAVAHAVARGALDPARFRLRLLGTVSLAVDVVAECRRLGIEGVVEFVPRVTRAESLREMKSASALLLIQTGTTVSVPGKAYEYLAAGRPILALSDEGETSALVRASGLGVSVRPDVPVEAVESALLDTIALARRGFAPAPGHLFDGRVQAAATASILGHLARHGRGSIRSAPALVAGSTVHEESVR